MWTAALIAMLGLIAADQSSAPAVSAPTTQATYDGAQAAYDRRDWEAAAAGFRMLLPGGTKTLRRSEAVIAERYADSLMRLNRLDDAEEWINRSVSALSDADLDAHSEAWEVKGDIERSRLDYAGAIAAYDSAIAGRRSAKVGLDVSLRAVLGLGNVAATVDPGHSFSALAVVLADPALSETSNRDVKATVEDLQARAAVNLGDKQTALRLSRAAVSDSGGLTGRVTLTQATIRGDAAIIAKLQGDDQSTNKYLTFTGAGHLPDVKWIGGHTGELPICGQGDAEISADDSAVVAFSISDEGRVIGAMPIYATRPGQIGVTFARAVSGWRWDPEEVKHLNSFWRSTLRLELRCITRPQPAKLEHEIRNSVVAWLQAKKILMGSEFGVDTGYFQVRKDDPRLALPGGAVLVALGGPLPTNEMKFQLTWQALEHADAPPAAYAILIKRWANEQRRGRDLKETARTEAAAIALLLPQFQQKFPADRALAWLVLCEALDWETGDQFPKAQPLLQSLLSSQTASLTSDDPIERVALLHRAIGLDRLGDKIGAKESLNRSGLTSDLCSLLDTSPVQTKSPQAREDKLTDQWFTWQFDGFVETGYDIADDGRVKNARVIAAYPPYFFDSRTVAMTNSLQYIPPRLGEESVSCGGQTFRMRYHINR